MPVFIVHPALHLDMLVVTCGLFIFKNIKPQITMRLIDSVVHRFDSVVKKHQIIYNYLHIAKLSHAS